MHVIFFWHENDFEIREIATDLHLSISFLFEGFLIGSAIKNPPSMTVRSSGSGRPWRRPHTAVRPAFVLENHGQRSLSKHSPRGRTELDTLKKPSKHSCTSIPTEANMAIVLNFLLNTWD